MTNTGGFCFAENLRNDLYDERDLDRIRTLDEFARGYLRHQNGDVTKAAAMMDTSLQWRHKMGLNGGLLLRSSTCQGFWEELIKERSKHK